MKIHSCRHCGERFETYTALEEHLSTHPNACSKCHLVFARPAGLLAHKCKVGDYLCESCQHTFSTQKQLDRHKRETACHHSLPPEPKRRRVTSSPPPFEEDPVEQPPPQQDSDLQDVITENWSSIRSHVTRGPVQSRYNYRLTSLDTRSLELRHIFEEQTTAFKINLSYGFILRNKQTGRYRFYHSSCNCCGRYLDEPSLITNAETFEKFLEQIKEPDLLNWVVSQRPNSDWICEMVTNVTFFVNKILQHPIGCVGIVLPPHIKRNKAIIGLETDGKGSPYVDNLCLFRCLGLHLGRDVTTLYEEYTNQPVWKFEGVVIDELHNVESMFEVNIVVYNLGAESAQLVRRSLGKHDNTMYVNLYEPHFSYIQDMKSYSHSYMCSKCEDSLWKYPSRLEKHELTCEAGVRHVYNGGVYHTTPSIFQRLDDEGITIPEALRFYPFRATFDFECYFDSKNLPADSDRVHWIARHVPLSVSLASNVPGYETPRCYVTEGDSDKLVADMMAGLVSTSDAAYDLLKPSYESVLEQ